MLSVLVAIGVGIALAVVTGIVFLRTNSKVNTVQRKLNKIENKLAAAGSTWLAEFLEDAVVGDVTSVEMRARALIEAEDSTQFFLDNISFPLTIYTIKETARYYPDLYNKIVEEVAANKPVKAGNQSLLLNKNRRSK